MALISLDAAYTHCRQLARHYENFPVGSILIPKKIRKHFFALYAFMRTADDFADIATRSNEERLKLLSDWRDQLDLIVERTLVRSAQTEGLKSVPLNPVFIALENTVTECKLSAGLFYKLLEAFEFDAKGDIHFQTFDDLRWYTSRSAEPVGELVLALFGYRDADRIRLSNDICTALQILNFIQDRKEDLEQNRDYYPIEDEKLMNSKGLSLFELSRVESLLEQGSPLAESVRGRLRYELRAVIFSARKMISKIRKLEGDTIFVRPKLSKLEQIRILIKALFSGTDF